MPPQASQAGAPTAPVEAEAGASGSVADDNLNAVLWVQTSAEYRAVAETVYRAATDQLDAALAQAHWDALLPSARDNAGDTASLKPAVIMDTAETVLAHQPYQAYPHSAMPGHSVSVSGDAGGPRSNQTKN